jgi:hypothetical protein
MIYAEAQKLVSEARRNFCPRPKCFKVQKNKRYAMEKPTKCKELIAPRPGIY